MKRTAGGDGLFDPEQKKEGAALYEEDALSRALGINRGRLQRARAALETGLWSYDHGRVAYTKKGALAAMRAVGVEPPAKKGEGYEGKSLEETLAAAELGAPAAGLEGCERLVVMRQALNTGIVMAGMMSDSSLPFGFACRVIVGNNANFVRGMEITAIPVQRDQYLYRMVGPLPRTRGRW